MDPVVVWNLMKSKLPPEIISSYNDMIIKYDFPVSALLYSPRPPWPNTGGYDSEEWIR
jgi:hypothetical protein